MESVVVLDAVDLELPAGHTAALVGRSGSGKSTLLQLAGGLAAPDRGQVLVGGIDPAGVSPSARATMRRRHIGFVFQFFHLLPALTVEENVALPLVLDRAGGAAATARSMLEQVGLDDRRTHYPAELSGGEMQRVAIARALVFKPTLILADEPTGNLDSATSATVLALLHSVAEEAGAAMLLVTHDQSVAGTTDEVYVMADGRLT